MNQLSKIESSNAIANSLKNLIPLNFNWIMIHFVNGKKYWFKFSIFNHVWFFESSESESWIMIYEFITSWDRWSADQRTRPVPKKWRSGLQKSNFFVQFPFGFHYLPKIILASVFVSILLFHIIRTRISFQFLIPFPSILFLKISSHVFLLFTRKFPSLLFSDSDFVSVECWHWPKLLTWMMNTKVKTQNKHHWICASIKAFYNHGILCACATWMLWFCYQLSNAGPMYCEIIPLECNVLMNRLSDHFYCNHEFFWQQSNYLYMWYEVFEASIKTEGQRK